MVSMSVLFSPSSPKGLSKWLGKKFEQERSDSPRRVREVVLLNRLAAAFREGVLRKGLSVPVRTLFFQVSDPEEYGLAHVPLFMCAHNKYLLCRDTVLWAVSVVEQGLEITEKDILNRGWFGISPSGLLDLADFKEKYWKGYLAMKTGKGQNEQFSQDEIVLGKARCAELLMFYAPRLKASVLYSKSSPAEPQGLPQKKSSDDALEDEVESDSKSVAKPFFMQATKDFELLWNFRRNNTLLFQELAELQGAR